MVQLDGASGDEQTHNHLEGKEIPPNEGAYEMEESNGYCRSLVIVHGRRLQMVFQVDLEGLWGIHTS